MAWLHPPTTARPPSATRDSLPPGPPPASSVGVGLTRPCQSTTEDALAGLLGLGSAPRVGSSPESQETTSTGWQKGGVHAPRVGICGRGKGDGAGVRGIAALGNEAWQADKERSEVRRTRSGAALAHAFTSDADDGLLARRRWPNSRRPRPPSAPPSKQQGTGLRPSWTSL